MTLLCMQHVFTSMVDRIDMHMRADRPRESGQKCRVVQVTLSILKLMLMEGRCINNTKFKCYKEELKMMIGNSLIVLQIPN